MYTEPKGVNTQMKALDEYILMVVYVVAETKYHGFVFLLFNLDRGTWQ